MSRHVVKKASYAICSSFILVIHDNMINETNHIVEHVFIDFSRSHGYYHKLTYHAKLTYVIPHVKRRCHAMPS
jgi:hypothetical protein